LNEKKIIIPAEEFGDKIIYMPKIRVFIFFSSHPVVSDLNQLVKKSKFIKHEFYKTPDTKTFK